ncbi:MarR family winged helix-turn-helix transcriptional regulator [Conexibacter sp. S30A1]|uniref:MarR family winged helix-turn-helix transcriptional regulator n=1 Tax=Conexibacter sp. S30A1 TaxID=2937800 RepID=UPI00200F1050|nr:MarR family transcriptional regulator [Conexibacter sp. S30A1]
MAATVQKPPTEVSLVYMIGRIDHAVRRAMRDVLAPWELSVPEFTALSILRRRPGLSNAQMARRTLVTPQSMIEILARLESRQLVARTSDPNHGRILRSLLTAQGELVVSAAQAEIDVLQDALLDGLSDGERELVLGAMFTAMQRLRASHRARS